MNEKMLEKEKGLLEEENNSDMSLSETKSLRKEQKSKTKDKELAKLRAKISEAIRVSKKYWLIFREGTFGLATILDLTYKRSFIEVLFFTNRAVLELGVPLLKIYTPIETEFDFNEVLLEPDFDEDGLVSPLRIINRLDDTIKKEVTHHLDVLEKEIDLINQHYENYEIEDNPFNRQIRIHFPKFSRSLNINFEKYPLVPKITYSGSLRRVIREADLLEQDFIKNWDEYNPLRVYELIKKIVNLVAKRLNILSFKEDSQHLIFENVSVKLVIQKISFKLHRGQSLGIVYNPQDAYESEKDRISTPHILFDLITGNLIKFSGRLIIFGTNVQLLSKAKLGQIFIIEPELDKKVKGMSVKKAIKHNLQVESKFIEERIEFEKLLKQANLWNPIDEISGTAYKIISQGPLQKWKRRNDFIQEVLDDIGLFNKKKKKLSELSAIDHILFSFGRVLVQSPSIIMISIPEGLLTKLQINLFNDFVKKIKEKYHLIVIIHGSDQITSECDEIITISGTKAQVGSIDDFLEQIPQEGEVISIELSDPSEAALTKIKEIQNAIFIEERKNEKYKIFTADDPNDLIQNLMKILGPSLYNFRRYKASISDYLEFQEKLEVKN